MLFVAALKAMAHGIILVHNHPSGNLTPSRADIDLTEKIKQAGEVLNITILDHLILTADFYHSFADSGEL